MPSIACCLQYTSVLWPSKLKLRDLVRESCDQVRILAHHIVLSMLLAVRCRLAFPNVKGRRFRAEVICAKRFADVYHAVLGMCFLQYSGTLLPLRLKLARRRHCWQRALILATGNYQGLSWADGCLLYTSDAADE